MQVANKVERENSPTELLSGMISLSKYPTAKQLQPEIAASAQQIMGEKILQRCAAQQLAGLEMGYIGYVPVR